MTREQFAAVVEGLRAFAVGREISIEIAVNEVGLLSARCFGFKRARVQTTGDLIAALERAGVVFEGE